MQADTIILIKQCVSQKRLDAYHQNGDDDCDVLARYAWNIRLCESFYPSLQTLEVVFRNSLHHSISNHLNSHTWLSSSCAHLAQRERDAVAKAEQELRRQNKQVHPDHLIPELTFGFWCSLLDRRYEQVFWPWLLKSVYPHISARYRTRQYILGRFNDIRRLRNRIFHHEPIWKYADLNQKHDEILESIFWISPRMALMIKEIDGFDGICQASYLSRLRALFNHKL